MRPVDKWSWPLDASGAPKSYNPHTIAKTDLERNLDYYCSYCEAFSPDLQVEHVISQNQNTSLSHNWDNFLLGCARCNGKGNKGKKHVDLNAIHFPHRNNTFQSFEYLEGGFVKINPAINAVARQNALNMIRLVGLDKYPGNADYVAHKHNDELWRHRKEAWELAKRYLNIYETIGINPDVIIDLARGRGFFSVGYTVFRNHPDVKRLLISAFAGTSATCFDPANYYNPINRNPQNTFDPT